MSVLPLNSARKEKGFMKKTILFFLLLCISFCISGCNIGNSTKQKYELVIQESEYVVSKPETTKFVNGDSIEIKTVILDDLDIELYLNGNLLRNRSYVEEDNKSFWEYKVIMPKEDSNITILTKEKDIINIADISTDEEVTYYYANDINGLNSSTELSDEQIEIFQGVYSKLLTAKAYKDVYCNCEAKLSFNYRYNHIEQGQIVNCFYKIAYHDHGIVVHNHAGYFQVIESNTFNKQLVLDTLGLFYVLEDDYIVPEYDSLKSDALGKRFLQSQNWPNNFGFGNLRAYLYGSVDSRDEAIIKYNDRVDGYEDYKYECSLKEENELYYLINVKQTHVSSGRTYEYAVMYYKNSIYDYANKVIYSNNLNVIKSILDNNFYSKYFEINGCRSLHSQLFDKGDHYLYVNYFADCVYGDWDVMDTLTYNRITTIIRKDGVIGKTNYKLIDVIYGEFD